MKIKFYEDCLITKGYSRSIIIDTTRKKIDAIPNSLSDFIEETDKLLVNEIKNGYSKEDCLIIDEYLDFLIENEYAVFIDDSLINNFPSIELTWDHPAKISNSIIAFNSQSWRVNIEKIILFLNEINCQDIEIRFENEISEEEIKDLIVFFEKTRVSTINLIIPYLEITNLTYDILSNYLRLEQIIMFNTPELLLDNQNSFQTKQVKLSKKSLNELFEIANINQFSPNLNLFSESQKHHTYFNRKLFFGVNGEIKNTPESTAVIDNLATINNVNDFKLVLNNESLSEYWFIVKEDCDACKDCEFRNICVDNRLPFQRDNGTWYHKKECKYNPYISKWADEEGYLSLKKLGIISDENGFSINKERIAIYKEKMKSNI